MIRQNRRSGGRLISLIAILILISFLTHPGAAQNNDGEDLMYQGNIFAMVENGSFQQICTIDELSEKGDFGVGAFEDMDGELLQLNGTVYRITPDGVVSIPPGETGITFVNTIRFNPELRMEVSEPENLTSLKTRLNETFPSRNHIIAVRMDGTFADLKCRSIPVQDEPYPPLANVIANQTVFELSNTTGTLMGFWFPDWMKGVNYAGYHLHYLSADKTAGGHILECTLENGTAWIDPITSFQVDIR